MPTEVNLYGRLRKIVTAKRSILKSVAKNLTEKNEEDEINSRNSKDKDENKKMEPAVQRILLEKTLSLMS